MPLHSGFLKASRRVIGFFGGEPRRKIYCQFLLTHEEQGRSNEEEAES